MGRLDVAQIESRRKVRVSDLWRCTAHFGAGLAMLRVAARHVGVLKEPLGALERTLEGYTDRRSEAFDRRHGTDTFARTPLVALGLDKPATGYEWEGWKYGPVDESFVREIIRHAPFSPEGVVFIDVGSGKGKAVLIAAEYPFRRVIGVELSDQLTAIARENLRKYGSSRKLAAEVELFCGDFMAYAVPEVPAVLFLNNPFPLAIAELAISHIEAHVRKTPGPTFVIYRKPPQGVTERLDASPVLQPVTLTPFWRIYRGLPNAAS
jgi:SAM-dependent methyltransferase